MPPVRLRRWAAAFFGVVAAGHGYWLLAYACGFDEHSRLYALLAMLDGVAQLIMTVAVCQYRRWLRDHYADLEHKEVWASHTLLLVVLLLLVNYGFADGGPLPAAPSGRQAK